MRPKGTIVERPLRALSRLLGALLLLAALGLVPVLGGACAAPTLPLPPPTALVTTPDDQGWVAVSGMARANALVMVYNEDRDEGVIVMSDAEGSYSARIQASIGETLTIWQLVGSDSSQLLSRVVPNR